MWERWGGLKELLFFILKKSSWSKQCRFDWSIAIGLPCHVNSNFGNKINRDKITSTAKFVYFYILLKTGVQNEKPAKIDVF